MDGPGPRALHGALCYLHGFGDWEGRGAGCRTLHEALGAYGEAGRHGAPLSARANAPAAPEKALVECGLCFDGRIYHDDGPDAPPRWEECSRCHGEGRLPSILYAPRSAVRGTLRGAVRGAVRIAPYTRVGRCAHVKSRGERGDEREH